MVKDEDETDLRSCWGTAKELFLTGVTEEFEAVAAPPDAAGLLLIKHIDEAVREIVVDFTKLGGVVSLRPKLIWQIELLYE